MNASFVYLTLSLMQFECDAGLRRRDPMENAGELLAPINLLCSSAGHIP